MVILSLFDQVFKIQVYKQELISYENLQLVFMINYDLSKNDYFLLDLTNLIIHNFAGHFKLLKHD